MKVTLCRLVPALGRLVGVVQVKLPVGLATPPLKIELLRDWPYVISEAVGQLLITGDPFAIVKVTAWLVEP